MKTAQMAVVLAACVLSVTSHAAPHHSKLYTPEELTVPVAAVGTAVPGDVAMPIVELMPLLIKQEKALNLSPEQLQALADYRQSAAPTRIALQKNLAALRAHLRQAILDNAPASERAALMDRITQTELMHMQARGRCADAVRTILTPAQFAQLRAMYVQGLSR